MLNIQLCKNYNSERIEQTTLSVMSRIQLYNEKKDYPQVLYKII